MSLNGPTGLVFAFGGGLVSFLSPCVLPLLPGYLAFMSGLGAEDLKQRENSRVVITAAALFVLGFSLVFVALGATASYIGSIVAVNRAVLTRIAGVFIIIMALVLIGFLRSPIFAMEKRFHLRRELGMWGSFPLGMAFGFGWSPCIGPVLTAVMAVAAAEGSVQKGALLLFVYALGLGVPFLLMALFAGRMFESLRWLKRHYRAFNVAGGAILLVMGIFLVMDRWTELLAPFMSWYGDLNLPT